MSTNEGKLFELVLHRPCDYFTLIPSRQWLIDKTLGVLDWNGGCSHERNINNCIECYGIFRSHFNISDDRVKYFP